MTITLQDLQDLHTQDCIRGHVHDQVLDAIQPQMDALEALFHRYSPRKIGKHHPEYEGTQP